MYICIYIYHYHYHLTDLLPTFWQKKKSHFWPSFIVQWPPKKVHQNWCNFCCLVPLKTSSFSPNGPKTLFFFWNRPQCRQQTVLKAYAYVHIYIYAFRELDQSAAYILGLFRKKNFFCPFRGNEEDLRGTKACKYCTKFWYTFCGHFHYKTGSNEILS